MSPTDTLNHLSWLPTSEAAAVSTLAQDAQSLGAQALLVGGCVRDALLGLRPKDVDVEVFGMETDTLEALLKRRFKVATVGKAFGVFKLKGLEIDVSLPRRESKLGTGHKGFVVEGDPHLSPAKAAARRDFTINAISFDPLNFELIDPLGGVNDLQQRYLRHCSDQFGEDPLRVLRAMQFIARFELEVAAETLEICRQIEPEDLPPERQFEEWSKLLLRGRKPSLGLHFLKAVGWVGYYPELEALIGCPQDPLWHPEGDVWTHTLHCLDAFARWRSGDPREDLVVGLAVLCHDLGKPQATVTAEDGRIRSPGHEKVGLGPTESFLRRLTAQTDLIEGVLPLVETHMRPGALYDGRSSDSAVRRLANKVGRIDRLVRVCQADAAGRPPLPGDFPAGSWLLERSASLEIADSAPKPLVMGRHLIAQGLKPGPRFGTILNACFEAQLDGAFDDEAGGLAFLKQLLKSGPEPAAQASLGDSESEAG
ncbi:MAG: CCA tRNA nucleotidyltransferase [Opitutales bacterium]